MEAESRAEQCPEVGRTFDGRYDVLALLGQGGAGAVYRVRDRTDGSIVALKFLTCAGESSQRRFRREFLAASRLEHRNVVAVLEMVEGPGLPYFTMEHIDGERLDAWVGLDGDLNDPARLDRLRRGLAQLLAALAYIHARSIVHRDLKPDNVLVTGAGELKLMDFGLVRERSASWVSLTGERVVGTLNYISPEQLDSRGVDARSDLYSLGALLYELLTGRLPFEAESVAAIITRVLHDAPRPPRAINPGVDGFLEALAITLLAKDPAHRFQSADELLAILERGSLGESHSIPVGPCELTARPTAAVYRSRLIGRDAELKALRDALEELRDGVGSVLMLAGDSGMGKSSLVAELEVASRAAGARFLLARGCQDATRPYAPLAAPFDELAMELALAPAADIAGLFSEDGRALSALSARFERVPAIASLPERQEPAEDEASYRTAAAAAQLLGGLARHAPVVFVAEDLHLWDRASLQLVHHIIRAVVHPEQEGLGGEAAPLMLFGTYRDYEAEQNDKLWRLLSMLRRRCLARWLGLSALNRREVQAMASAMMGDVRRLGGLGDWLYAETEGNPHFVAETLKMLVDERYFVRDRGVWRLNWQRLGKAPRVEACAEDLADIPVPLGIRELLERRIARLDPLEKRVLEAAAVIGRDFEFDLLMAALGMGEDELLDVLDGLLKARMVVERDAREDVQSFDHDKLREVLIGALPAAERRLLHERVGRALESQLGAEAGEHVVRLAHHFSEAGLAERALVYLPAAGARLAAAHLNEEAIKAYQGFLGFAAELPSEGYAAQRDAALEVKKGLARILRLTGRYQASIELNEQLLGDIAADDRGAVVAEVLIEVATVEEHLGRYVPAAHIARRAHARARAAGARGLEASALQVLGTVLANRGESAEALARHEEALAITRELGDARGTAAALNSMANVCFSRGELELALRHHEEALELRRTLGERIGVAASLNNIGNIAFVQGHYEAALRHHAESLSIRRELGNRKGIAFCHANIGAVLVALGDYDEAREHLELSLEMSRELEDRKLSVIDLINLAHVSNAEGQTERAREELRAAREVSRQIGNRLFEPDILLELATAAAHTGQLAEALANASEAVELARALGGRQQEALGLLRLAELSHGEVVLGLAERAHELAEGVGDALLKFQTLQRLGVVELELGREEAGNARLEAARALLAELAERAGSRRRLFLATPAARVLAAPDLATLDARPPAR